ncbi:hypothetical protein ADK57_25150 [Streptomyces sp. MMG1533]|uniref:nucleoside-diphosphate kinase n=1 Tax=Streptomyces sp. MMG1533 TaxID=1415546 RepID=UPI0006B052FE|nr:nucleoside-diphosphate kinase [Streptomyces sp. MMG1533]KOU62161.1 hypothetical protein ADK57_25150 [Streptomyces sp. MMG1533]
MEPADALSRVREKLDLFSVDPYYRDVWEDLLNFTGGSPRESAALLWNAAPLVIRSDGLQAGNAELLIAAAADHGFRPVVALPFTFTRHVIRETWRYQLNIAHRDRIDVMDLLLQDETGLYVMLERTDPDPALPATVLLNEIKGATPPEKRLPHQLRSLAGPTQLSVVTYIHVSDEPADVIREMGVFFDREDRLRILGSLGRSHDGTEDVRKVCVELQEPGRADFALSAAISRLQDFLGAAPATASARRLTELVSAMKDGSSIDWREVLDLVRQTGIELGRDDAVAIAGHFCQGHLDGEAVIPDSGLDAWRTPAPDEPSAQTR